MISANMLFNFDILQFLHMPHFPPKLSGKSSWSGGEHWACFVTSPARYCLLQDSSVMDYENLPFSKKHFGTPHELRKQSQTGFTLETRHNESVRFLLVACSPWFFPDVQLLVMYWKQKLPCIMVNRLIHSARWKKPWGNHHETPETPTYWPWLGERNPEWLILCTDSFTLCFPSINM